ncbi:MAG: hypothetical protein B7733_15635 [Myxococcales bacterium FL481]|nr:MAG: hypothetical protein B7733_15635 [Myxococcales bacterium FL481]
MSPPLLLPVALLAALYHRAPTEPPAAPPGQPAAVPGASPQANRPSPVGTPTPASASPATAQTSSAPDAQSADTGVDEYQDNVLAALAPQMGGLTAAEVARRAAVSAPAMAVKRAELKATAADLDRTMVRYIPSLNLTGSYIRNNKVDIDLGGEGASVGALNEGPIVVGPCPDNPATQCVVDSGGVPVMAAGFAPFDIPVNNYSLQAALSVPFSEYAMRLLPAKRGSESELGAAELRRDAEQVRVQLDAQLAYYDWLRAVAQLAVAERSITSASARLVDGQAGLAAGTLTSTDVLRLEDLVSSAEVSRVRAASFERLARQHLGVIMEEPEIGFKVGEDVFEPVPTLASWGAREDLVHEGQTNRLEIRSMLRSADALDYAVRALRGDLYPQLAGIADVTHANPNQRFFPATNEWNTSWMVGLSLTWQLGRFLDARLLRTNLRAQEDVVQAQVLEMRRAIELEVNAAWEEYTRAQAALVFDQRSATVAQAAYDEQVALYRAGEATTTDILQAELARMNATLREVNDRIDLHVAKAKLDRASGRMQPAHAEASP